MKLNRHSIIQKMVVIFTVIILLPSLVISSMYYRVVNMRYENNILTYFDMVLEQYQNSIDYQLERYKQVMKLLMEDEEIIALTENSGSELVFDISTKYMPTMLADGQIFRCTLYSKNAPEKSEYSFDYIKDEAWFRRSVEEGRYSVWFSDSTKGRNIALLSVIYPVRKNRISTYKSTEAILKLDLYMDKVTDELYPKEWNDTADCVIFSEDGQILWQKGENTAELADIVNSADDIQMLAEEGGFKDNIKCKKIHNQNLYILCKMEQSYLKSGVIAEQLHILAQLVILLIIISTMLVLFMRSFSTRINTVTAKIRKIEKLDFSPSEKVGGNDEIAMIDNMIDTMSERLSKLISTNYEQKLQIREAELRALHFQINPHFLYNVLASISEIAYIEGAEKTADMSQKLGAMFRYTTEENSDGKVELKKEIKYLRDYIEIQNIRFDDKFELIINVPEELNEVRILKFSLQPLIENAVKYAFAARKKGTIGINAMIEGDDLVIIVEDDGIGITPEKLNEIETKMKCADDRTESGIGICNVNSRLVLQYGENYGLRIQSKPEHGTAVTVRFFMKEGNSDV